MNRDIKTRNVVKNIKTLSKNAGSSRTIKTFGAKTKEAADEQAAPQPQKGSSPQSYAEGKVESSMADSTRSAAQGVRTIASRAEQMRGLSKNAAGVTARRSAKRAADTSINATRKTAASLKQSKRATVKTASRQIKNTGKTTKAALSASKQGARAAKGAQAASKVAARNAAYAGRMAARTASLGIKAAARGITAFVKMAIAAVKSLAAAVAALGTTAVAVILIVCLVALITVSAFGIFFMGGDMGDGNPTLREVVSEINQEHNQKIDEIKAANPHDDFSLAGTKTQWKEVLATFAVKVTTDPDKPFDVVTLDAERQQLLRKTFWDMNSIDHRVEEREVTEIVLEKDEDGSQKEVPKTTTVKTLTVSLSHKSADEAGLTYGFTTEQFKLLHQLLDSKYDSTWQSVLYGVRNGTGDIVEVALAQVGNVGGQPYWSWYGFGGRVEWCACFVSWCANECGYVEAGIIPRFSYCPTGVDWFKSAGLWQDRGYAPQPGDIIFFDWGGDGVSDHVGIVESCDGTTVRTIEGNSGDACQQNSYSTNSSSIMGYGTPLR